MSRPRILLTDNGLEFTNNLVNNYLQKVVKIQHVTTKNAKRIKGLMIERANRTLKNILVKAADNDSGRYVDSLQAVVRGYNNTVHSATGAAPNSIDPLNIDKVRDKMLKRRISHQKQQFGSKTWDTGKVPKLAVGDWVHMAVSRHKNDTFRRGYDPSFSTELYQIAQVIPPTTTTMTTDTAGSSGKFPFAYKLKDLTGSDLTSVYYYPELSKTVFPHKFKIVSIERQFTDKLEGDGTKYKLVKIAQYNHQVWLPDKKLQDRPAEDKRTNTISSSLFMHWLNE